MRGDALIGRMVYGVCLCHGVEVVGKAGTTAQPGTYRHADVWTGKAQLCVAVLEGGGTMPHDLPVGDAHLVNGGGS